MYEWLAEKKREAMMQKLQRRGMPSYRQLPISERFGVNFTGYGPNRRLDPQAPAGIAGREIYHEGEIQARLPEGNLYVDAQTTGVAYPETEQQQAEMKLYEKKGNLPGFAAGGFSPIRKDPRELVTPQVNQNPPAATMAARTMTANQPQTNTIDIKPPQPEIKPVQVAKQVTAPQITASQPTVTDIKLPQAEIKPVQPVTTPNQITVPPAQNISIRPAASQVQVPQKTAEEKAREVGMKYLTDALKTGDQASTIEGHRAMDELSTRHQQERSALEQQLIQQGVDPGRARVEAQMLRNQQESELNSLAAKFGIAGMQNRQQIAGTVASQGLQGQQFELEKKQYGESADWKAYEEAVRAGDFDTAAQAYQKVTGKPISMDQMKLAQSYYNQTQQLTVDSLRNKVGDEKWSSIQNRINSGASLAQINAEFPGLNLTQEDYKGMYEATALGERNFERNMGYARTLLEAGGEQNIKSAAGILNTQFPGIGIDFTNVITQDKAKTFNSGLSQLSSYVAAGLDYEEAIAAMKADGTYQMLGMNDTDVSKLYRGLKVNAIDEQYKQLTESDWWNGRLTDANGNLIRGPTDEEKNDMQTFLSAVLSGKLDYSIEHEYEVTKDGKTTTVYSTDNYEKFLAKNPGATVVDTKKPRVIPKGSTTGGTAETVSVPSGKSQGDVFISNGKIYKVGSDKKPVEASLPTDVWGNDATKILSEGREGNPYYDEIIEKRLNESVKGDQFGNTYDEALNVFRKTVNYDRWKNQLRVSNVDDAMANDAVNTYFSDNLKSLKYDDPTIQKLKTDIESITKETMSGYGKYMTIVKDGTGWKAVFVNK